MILLAAASNAQSLIISEFRLRGPSGANDEFVEIYNNSNTAITVAGGGTGYAVAASDGVARFVIPNGTVIPARGHYLGTNSVAYSLSGYATGDATFATDIPDNAGIALFNTSVAGNFTLANRLDAVGSTSEANTVYKEGTGYSALTPFSIDYTFFRRNNTGLPVDTDNNTNDFKFEDTNGTSAGAGQSLGAPGPENLASPVTFGGGIVVTVADVTLPSSAAPNFVRDFTSIPAQNSTFGQMDFRLKITNNTGAPVTRLRLRITDLTTFPSPSGIADLRPITCASTSINVTGVGAVTAQGTTLEQPPSQPNGGGINSSLGISTISLGTPLGVGATSYIRIIMGIQQTGTIKTDYLLEALPQGSAGNAGSGTGASAPFVYRGTDAFPVFNPIATPLGDVIISEFRVRGPNGANDEFVELYNTTNNPITVFATDGSAGWAVAASNGVARFVVPNGTIIPAHGHYLGVNSVGYSLASYPSGNGTTATGDITYTTDIPDNAGIALFNTATPGNFAPGTKMDAVGSTSEANTLYKEGAGYPALTPFSIDYTFHRKINAAGVIVDAGDNAADFKFEDTNGTSAGAGQSLGAPGPQNLSSPIRTGTSIVATLADPTLAANVAPNYVRDLTSVPAQNSTFGTIALRYKITNAGALPVTRLRFRLDSINTFPSPSGIADLRPRTSTSAAITVTGVGAVTAEATTLEQPPSQPNGGGFNSTFSAGTVTLGTPLASGASVYVNLLFGIQQTGVFNITWGSEALPEGGTTPVIARGNTNPCPVITVTNPATTTGTAGTAFSQSFTQSGGVTPVTFTTSSTLPAGLTLSSAGVLSGTPSQTGTFPIVVTVTDANTCTGTNATYNLVINCPVLTHTNVLATPANVCLGSSTVITGTANGGVLIPPTVTTTSSGAINLAITDNSAAGVNSTIAVPAAALNGASALKVKLNIGHSWVGDLKFTLTSPCGVSIILDRPGVPASTFGNSNNLGTTNASSPPSPPPATYTFDISAAGVISETALAPGFIPTGSYRPSNTTGAAHDFSGITFPCAAAGNWTLNISDNGAGDIGTLIDWEISTTSGGTNYTHTLTGPGTITQNPASGVNNSNASFNVAGLPLGSHVFTLTSTDPIGCSVATTPINVTVNPLPTITCPANITVNNTAGVCGAVVTFAATATGTPTPTITYSPASGSTFPVGTTTVTATATNTCGSVSCTFTVTVNDTQTPTITCPANLTRSNDAGICGANVAVPNATTADNCAVTRLTWVLTGATTGTSPATGVNNIGTRLFNQGTTTATYTIADAAGNSTTCSFTVTVNDTEAPAITCPANISKPSDAGLCTTSVVVPNATTTDNCGITRLTWALTGATTGTSPATGINNIGTRTFNGGVTTATYTIADAAGNISTCSFTITVTDFQLPVISVQPANRTVCAGTNATFSVTTTNAVSYQWQQFTTGAWSNIAGATASSFTVNGATTAQNTNTYRVVITGLCSVVTSGAASLYVNPLPSITLTSTNPGILLPTQFTNIVATVNPTGGTFAWFKDGAALVPAVTGGTLSNLGVNNIGTYRAVYTDPNGCVNTSADLVISGEFSENLFVAPNPNFGQFTVRYNNSTNELLTVSVFNSNGTRVYQKTSPSTIAYTQISVDLLTNAPGVYVVELRNSAGNLLGRKNIIVSHK